MACTEIIKIKEMNPFFAWTFGPWVVLLLTFPLPLLLSLVVSICVLMPLMAMMSKFVPSRSFLIGAILIAAILVSPLFFLEKLHWLLWNLLHTCDLSSRNNWMDFLGYVFVLRELQEQMQRRTIGAMTTYCSAGKAISWVRLTLLASFFEGRLGWTWRMNAKNLTERHGKINMKQWRVSEQP